jgi:hypothetical protein
MQDQKGPDGEDQQHSRGGETAEDTGRNAAELVATMPSRVLMAKNFDAFVFANLLKPKLGSEPTPQELQRRLFQPGKEAGSRQEHSRGALLSGVLGDLEDLSDLLLGKPVHVVKDEQRWGWIHGFRSRGRAATRG